MPHSVRQEFKLDIGGRSFTLRPTFIGLDKLETYLNVSIFVFTNHVATSGSIKLRDMCMVVQSGLYGDYSEDNMPSVEDIGELILSEGPMLIVPKLTEYLMTSMLDESQAAEIHKASTKGKGKSKGNKKGTTNKPGK